METEDTIALREKINSMTHAQLKKRWATLFNKGFTNTKITLWEQMEFSRINNILFPCSIFS